MMIQEALSNAGAHKKGSQHVLVNTLLVEFFVSMTVTIPNLQTTSSRSKILQKHTDTATFVGGALKAEAYFCVTSVLRYFGYR